ncbi:hypothetical protein [Natrinema sp. DC36]|uniref:hypothetical protein n=1 Tax=Natrinema sp. DC36 TaxID=2878680 RepID=UPI001CEFC1F3|nr:hypothetical protein [Natrinema sp. DC36]
MEAVTFTDDAIVVEAGSWAEPLARAAKGLDLPKEYWSYLGQELIEAGEGLAEAFDPLTWVLAQVAVIALLSAMQYSIVIQKSISAAAELGVTATAKLSSE